MNYTYENFKEDAYQSVEQAFSSYQKINFMNVNDYANWLAQTYFYVHHVTRILAFAASKCDLYQEPDLHFRLVDHLNEERDHDKMLLNDLENLGFKIEDFTESMQTRSFYQSLFYMIETYGPYSLIGYFIPQEGLACLKLSGLYKELASLYGERSCSFLKEHCELDIEHFGEALEFVESLEQNKLEVIKLGMTRSAELYNDIMSDVSTKLTTTKNHFYSDRVSV